MKLCMDVNVEHLFIRNDVNPGIPLRPELVHETMEKVLIIREEMIC